VDGIAYSNVLWYNGRKNEIGYDAGPGTGDEYGLTYVIGNIELIPK